MAIAHRIRGQVVVESRTVYEDKSRTVSVHIYIFLTDKEEFKFFKKPIKFSFENTCPAVTERWLVTISGQ